MPRKQRLTWTVVLRLAVVVTGFASLVVDCCRCDGGGRGGHRCRGRNRCSCGGPPSRSVMSKVIALQRWMPDIAEREVFLCGPSTWTDGMERLFLAAGVPTDRIHSESSGW